MLQKNFFTPKTQIWTFEKKTKIVKMSSFLNGSSSVRIKISEKIKNKKFTNYFFVKVNQLIVKNRPGSGSVFSSADPGSGSASKLNKP